MKQARNPADLRRVQEERDLTIRELARLAGCSEGTVRKVLAGQRVGAALAGRIARSLRVAPSDIFADATASDEQQSVQQRAMA